MNKEEIRKIINDPIIEQKVTDATNILMDLYELGFNNGLKVFQPQLDIANKKIDEIKEYVLENTYENPQYMDGISQLYDEKLNHILSIIGGNNE